MEVVSSAYIDNYRAQPGAENTFTDLSKAAPLISPMLPKEKVRRAIVFIVDDLSMSFEHPHNARMSLKKFVESQMQPGDMIAIMRTSSGGAHCNCSVLINVDVPLSCAYRVQTLSQASK